jgi:hypothetical protein
VGAEGFQQVPYAQKQLAVLCCIEHERLEFKLIEVRTRGQYLTRLRRLSREEQAEWDRREQQALSNLVDHELEHGCSG